jgi:hypothetical protein
MKKIALLALQVILPFIAAAQNPSTNPIDFLQRPVVLGNGDFYVVDSLYCYLFDTASKADIPVERQYNLSFDENGATTASRNEKYLAEWEEWRNSTYTVFSYDASGTLTEQVLQTWDTLSQTWLNNARTQNFPNGNGGFSETRRQRWYHDDWENLEHTIFSYDQFGHIASIVHENWDTLTLSWKRNFRILYAVNTGNQVVFEKFQLFDPAVSDFKDISQTYRTYDANFLDLEIESRTEIKDAQGAWVNSSRSTKMYDTRGNLTLQTFQLWNLPDSTWVNQSRLLQNFNVNDEVTLRTEQLWNNDTWVNFFQTNNIYDDNENLERFEVSQWAGTLWERRSSCDFYWRFHHEVSVMKEAWKPHCRLSNPLRPGQVVFCENWSPEKKVHLSFYTMEGVLIHRQLLDNQTVDTGKWKLPPGLYLLRFHDDRTIFQWEKVLILP